MDLFKYLYRAGVWFRNDKIPGCYDSLKGSEGWDLPTLREHQLQRLRALLQLAYDGSPFYRSKFAATQLRPQDVQTLEDLKRVPVTTKAEVLQFRDQIQLGAGGEKRYYSETSGSTGTPLVFYRNQEWDAWHNASVMRGYSWHGVDPWESNGYLWGYNIAPKRRAKIKILDLLQNRFRLFSYKAGDIDAFIDKLTRARYLSGYSSMLYEVAKRVNARGNGHDFALKMIKGTSEKIFDSYQSEVEKAFGRRIVSEYGSAEGGIIAFECRHGKMHINMETVIVEEEDGEILLTNLVSSSFPIIRYKIGDYVVLGGAERCACGMAHQTIREVTGRVGAVIYGRDFDYPSLTLYYVFKNLAAEHLLVLNYQVVQEVKGRILVYIESKLSEPDAHKLRLEFRKYFADDLEIEISDGIARSNFSAKKKDFISKVTGT
jgi:phenylacetate-CoA ligase